MGERRIAVVRSVERMETLLKAARAWPLRSAAWACVTVQPCWGGERRWSEED